VSSKFGAGFLLGVVLAGAVSLVWVPSAQSLATVPAAPAVAEPLVAPWLEPDEARVDSAFILPRGLEVADGFATLSYDLAGLSPSLVEHEDADYQGDVVIAPEHWVLTTTGGAQIEATTGRRDSSVRFELPPGDQTVAAVNLVRWRIATPFGERLELPIAVGSVGTFRSGTVTVDTVLEQRLSTIVQFDFDETADEWQLAFIRPTDPAWRASGGRSGGFQLSWDGDDAPTSLILEDAGFEMRAVTGDILVVDQRDVS